MQNRAQMAVIGWHPHRIILAKGAKSLSMTPCGDAIFASWKLLQFPSGRDSVASCNFLKSFCSYFLQNYKVSCRTEWEKTAELWWNRARKNQFEKPHAKQTAKTTNPDGDRSIKLTWPALGEDHAALSGRVEQLTALSEVCKALEGSFGFTRSTISDSDCSRSRGSHPRRRMKSLMPIREARNDFFVARCKITSHLRWHGGLGIDCSLLTIKSQAEPSS